ncbi:MAG: hypothetical protein ACFB0Z_05255 [Candidatus Phaeomarinobacter sp.]
MTPSTDIGSGHGGWVTIDIDGPASVRPQTAVMPESDTPEGFEVLELEFTGTRAQAVENGRNRMALLAACFLAAFVILGMRVLELTLADAPQMTARTKTVEPGPVHRTSITDRSGSMLATDVVVPSLYVDARKVIEPVATADALLTVLPDLNREKLLTQLYSGRAFQWIKRQLGPRQQAAVHALGLPGIGFKREPKRVYPKGTAAAQVLG